MRGLILAAAGAAILSTTPAKAEVWYPWCVYYSWSTYNCGFVSQRQCLATAVGAGGRCRPNPAPPPRRPERRSDIPAGQVPAARAGEPARMIQLPNGRWISSYGCVIDEGYGRYSDCNRTLHD